MPLQTLGNLGNFIVAVTAVFLLWQGQQDRRNVRRQDAEQRARMVTLSVHQQTKPHGKTSYSILSTALQLRNDGDMPVHIQGLALMCMDSWENLTDKGYSSLQHAPLDFGPRPLHPRQQEQILVPASAGWIGDTWSGSDFAVLEFRDEGGLVWLRRSDTGELKPLARQPPPWQRLVNPSIPRPVRHAILVKPLVLPLLSFLSRGAIRRARAKGPETEPWQLRAFRFIWGYWGAGEIDEWYEPQGAPALWRYDEMPKYRTQDPSGWSTDPPEPSPRVERGDPA